MESTTTMPVTTGTLDVPDARLYYEVRGAGPLVVLVGAPMDAGSFAPLADLLAADHTVLTTDPRGIHRSVVHDPDRDSTPERRADDLARLIAHVGAGAAVVFGSSGGAVSALALAQAHPERVSTVIAHEPPLLDLLPDRDDQRRRTEHMIATYLAGDVLDAWREFFATAGIPIPDEAVVQMFGGERPQQVVTDERFWFTSELRPTAYWSPRVDLLRAGTTRLVAAIGEASRGQFCDRTTTALAEALGIEPTWFPGDHAGFVHDPEAFATRFREVCARS
jgi:pimeloyl-ACP methyl ester carboxylesterase